MASFDLLKLPVQETVTLVANHLAQVTTANDKIPGKQRLTRFHARSKPSIDVAAYAARILKYAPCGNECFLAALIYFERMTEPSQRYLTSGFRPTSPEAKRREWTQQLSPPSPVSPLSPNSPAVPATPTSKNVSLLKDIVVDSYNVHRLLITGVMVAVKFLSDVFFTNLHYSRVGGLPVHELNELEIDFLLANDFNLNISLEELQYAGDRLLQASKSSKLEPSPSLTPPSPHKSHQHNASPVEQNSTADVEVSDSRGNGVAETSSVSAPSVNTWVGVERSAGGGNHDSQTRNEYMGSETIHSASTADFASPPACMEPRYAPDPFSAYTSHFDPRNGSRTDESSQHHSWHMYGAAVHHDGHTLLAQGSFHRHSRGSTTSPSHHRIFKPYDRPTYHRHHTISPPYSFDRSHSIHKSPTRSQITPTSTYSSPPYSPPNAPCPPHSRQSVSIVPSEPRRTMSMDERRLPSLLIPRHERSVLHPHHPHSIPDCGRVDSTPMRRLLVERVHTREQNGSPDQMSDEQ